ncbi:hypothetical protein [Propionivibrio sp.]|nr:hypothetical protein [Propionivibrio sp.]MBK8743933.1 hypothetical protein [Propionivibrio sp.]MBK8892935.1 hypothetical protein [Propionivibrio sp.]
MPNRADIEKCRIRGRIDQEIQVTFLGVLAMRGSLETGSLKFVSAGCVEGQDSRQPEWQGAA